MLLIMVCLQGCAPDIAETDFYQSHPDAVEIGETLIELGEQSKDGLTFRLLAPENLHTGYSTVWIDVQENGVAVPAGRMEVTPVWYTNLQAVVSPLATVSASKRTDEDRFEAVPFFLQTAQDEGRWDLQVEYDVEGKTGTVDFTVDVQQDIWVQHVEADSDYAGSDYADSDYYVSWVLPVRPSTGNASIQFALHRLTDAGFIAIEDAVIDLYPYMDMGAGEGHSTPFEAPRHSGSGFYTGQINFIMSGGWDMTAYIQRPSAAPDTVVFRGFTVFQ